MSAALIPAQLVPIARTDADWAFDIGFPDEDWTGSEVKVAFARQGLPEERFEIDAEAPTSDLACAVRLPADFLAAKAPGTYSVQVRKVDGEAIDDAAVFRLMLYRGVSDTEGTVAPPTGDGVAIGSVVVSRVSSVSVVRGGAGPVGPAGTAAATTVAFNDALTMLGVDNVQDAIVALYALIGSGPAPTPGGSFDFTLADNSALIGAL